MTDPTPKPASRRAVLSWALYDWANSAYPTLIATFVFAAYFTKAVAETPESGTTLWGNAVALSGLLIALVSPVAGSIADQTGRRKPWLGLFSVLCILSTALLWFTEPAPGSILWALTLVVISNLAFEVGIVFYNAMLPELVRPERLGRVSGWAWGLGYAGGLAALVISLLVFVQAEVPPFGLDKGAAEHVRVTTLLVAGWFALFSIPLFLFTPDAPAKPVATGRAVRAGLATLWHTLRHIGAPERKTIARYLLARMLYIDGLNTLFAFGGIYAAGTFGMSFEDIIKFGIAMNVTAGFGAFVFGWIDDALGSKRTIVIALVAMIGLGLGLLVVRDVAWFWGLALCLGLFMGPAQAASRTLMARLAPPAERTEMFGLYALTGKVTAFLGPFVLAQTTAAFDSQRAGMATIVVFLVLGLGLLATVREPGR